MNLGYYLSEPEASIVQGSLKSCQNLKSLGYMKNQVSRFGVLCSSYLFSILNFIISPSVVGARDANGRIQVS